MIKVEVVFPRWDDAKAAAEYELKDAGFLVEVTDDIDVHSGLPSCTSRAPASLDDGIYEMVEAIVDPFDGLCPECWAE
jgi:hypothetical protein